MTGQINRTLDQFEQRPLSRRTAKFIELCNFYANINGNFPTSGFQVADFISQNTLPFHLRHFKLLSENQIIAAFWKWQRIMGLSL